MLINSPQHSEAHLCPNTRHRHSSVRGLDHGIAFLFVFEDVASKNLPRLSDFHSTYGKRI